MTMTANLPIPPNWRRRTVTIVVAAAILLVIAVAFGMLAVRAVRHEHWVAAVIAAAASSSMVMLGVIAVGGRIGFPRPRRRHDAEATVLDLQPIRGGVVFALLMLVVASGLQVFDRSAANTELAVSDRMYGKLIIVFAVSVLATLASLPGIGRHVGRLTLSPERISLVDYWGRTHSVSWADIADIGDQALKGKTFQPIVIVCKGGAPLVINSAPAYGDNGAPLYWMLRHYWQTPADRLELMSGVALQRLAQHRFAVH